MLKMNIFLNLDPKTYTVAEVLQNGWTQTFPGGDGTHVLALGSGKCWRLTSVILYRCKPGSMVRNGTT